MKRVEIIARLLFPLSLFAATAISCEHISYTPYETDVPDEFEDLTRQNINRFLAETEGADEIRIAVIGDPQRQLDTSEDFVAEINSRDDVDLVVVAGDLTNYGLNKEYVRFAEVYGELEVPYLTVIGNHDYLGKGEFLYEKVFGPDNYTVDVGGFRLVFFDAIGIHTEDNIVDFAWLADSIDSANGDFSHAVLFAHVPVDSGWAATSPETAEATAKKFEKILVDAGTVNLSVSGHKHRYKESDLTEDIQAIIVDTPDDRNYLYLTVDADGYTTERVFY